MTKILTIAIPAYNMESFLSRCLDSVLIEQLENFIEVLLINDGSKDNTLNIAREYETKFPQMLVVIDKANGGWGSAINVAINKATGKYFKILDSDDWFETNALNKFITLLKNLDVDLVASSFSYEYTDKESKNDIYDPSLCNKVTLLSDYLKNKEHYSSMPMAALCFKTSILKENNINLSARYYADIEYHLIPLIYVQTVYFTEINLYKYFIGREGQSTSIAGYNKNLENYITLCKNIALFYSTHNIIMDENIKKMFSANNLKVINFAYRLLLSPEYSGKKESSKQQLIDLDAFLKKNSTELYSSSNKLCVRKVIPFIYIWRITGINIFNLK